MLDNSTAAFLELTQESLMDRHNQRASRARRPLLLNFVRRQPVDDLEYRYDPGQHLNVAIKDGVPVVATALGRAQLKTLGVAAED
jgi:hypothetical protein